MKPELIDILRMRWLRLRIYRRPGSVLVDYRILRNFVRIYHSAGAA
ncbi:YlcG family protein [Salmonella enterica subsp. enterica serovar Muenster]|nr:YlcG family protein [Salmonella enterica]ECO1003466.1 YlcG family protein [Salmonella enterica subsp. enterica serovar Give]EDA3111967.1 YlcG family protein [Salmonella enterica subsp. enterica serovar Sandiego]EDB9085763.1 YlcG family protein [Salmonella enterica subsp. enterica serovar Newport]EAA7635237.1 YlcG family protein [Salmonella enterica]EAA8874413.1 YlcG family protein [Salmonella enterica]